jgi:hypothetical protein
MKIKEGFVVKKINDFYAVVPVNSKTIDFKGMMTLNSSAKLLYDALQEEQALEDLVAILMDQYDIDNETALKDVNIFIAKLDQHKLITY